MNRMIMIASLAFLLTGPAFADAIEGQKSPAEILAATTAEDWRAIPAEETLVIELERGKVTVALSPALAPWPRAGPAGPVPARPAHRRPRR